MKTFCDRKKATAGSTSECLASFYPTDGYKVRDVAFIEVEVRGMTATDLDVELPRSISICANGGNVGEMVQPERKDLFRIAAKRSLDDHASSP